MSSMTVNHGNLLDTSYSWVGYIVGGLILVGITWRTIQSNQDFESLQADIRHNQVVVTQLITECQKRNNATYQKLMEQYTVNTTLLLEQNQKLIQMLKELAEDEKKKDCVGSYNVFSPIKPPEIVEADKLFHQSIIANEDDELMNECYDAIPLNNIKKHTKSVWYFT